MELDHIFLHHLLVSGRMGLLLFEFNRSFWFLFSPSYIVCLELVWCAQRIFSWYLANPITLFSFCYIHFVFFSVLRIDLRDWKRREKLEKLWNISSKGPLFYWFLVIILCRNVFDFWFLSRKSKKTTIFTVKSTLIPLFMGFLRSFLKKKLA